MTRILQFLCGSLLVISMTSCGNKTTPVENSATTPETSPAATTKVSPDKVAGFVALQEVVNSTKKAVEAGKLDAAKNELAKFEPAWKTVEDDLKSKSPENYRAVEDSVKAIETGIAKKQSKDTLLAILQKLGQTIDKASK